MAMIGFRTFKDLNAIYGSAKVEIVSVSRKITTKDTNGQDTRDTRYKKLYLKSVYIYNNKH